MFKRLLLIAFSLFSFSNANAQIHKPDWDEWDDWGKFEVDFGKYPYLETTYGIGNAKLKSFNADFHETGLVELRLGYRSVDEYYDDYIVKSKDNFTFFQYISPELKSKNLDNSKLDLNAWRFGFGNLSGFGYKIGKVSIIPYTEMNFVWTKLEHKNLSDYVLHVNNFEKRLIDTTPIDIYEDNFRFGTTSSIGAKVELASSLSLNNSYDFSVVYPRHLFWKNTGSLVIEAIGGGFIDYFVEEVMDTSPAAGPVINILLKGSLSYAFYSLRRDNMNWPFGGEKPITFEHYRIGLTFTF